MSVFGVVWWRFGVVWGVSMDPLSGLFTFYDNLVTLHFK